jgi:hypothetical protein
VLRGLDVARHYAELAIGPIVDIQLESGHVLAMLHTTRSAEDAFAAEGRQLSPTHELVHHSDNGRLTRESLKGLPGAHPLRALRRPHGHQPKALQAPKPSRRTRPDPLEPPAPGSALICCARPETDLVLDL